MVTVLALTNADHRNFLAKLGPTMLAQLQPCITHSAITVNLEEALEDRELDHDK